MRRSAIGLSLIFALGSFAQAAPWEHQTDDYGHEAYQGSKDGKYLLAFVCGDDAEDGAFYILTPEPYEATTSYADVVPTTFTLSEKALEISGVFEERTGKVSVYFTFSPQLVQLFDLVANATGDIEASFFDKQVSFSSEGSAAALAYATDGSPDTCNPYKF